MKPGKKINRLLSIALVAFSIVFAVAIGEIFLRYVPLEILHRQLGAYGYEVQGKIYEYGVDKINLRLKPLSMQTVTTPEYQVQYFINSLGFRDYEFTVAKPENIYRIIVIGDSATYGSGVEIYETFAKRLERTLNEKSPLAAKRIQVLNFGVGSYSGGQNYVFIRDYLKRYEADLVILVHFANDEMEWPFYAEADGLPDTYVVSTEYWNSLRPEAVKEIKDVPPEEKAPKWLEDLAQQSAIADLISKSYLIWIRERSDSLGFQPGDVNNDAFWPLREGVELDQSPAWKRAERITVASKRLVESAGAEFLLLLMPSGVQVNGFEWDEGRGPHGFKKGNVAPPAANRLLKQAIEKDGGKVLDLTPGFRRVSSKKRRLYYPYDGHLTPFGHDVATRLMTPPVQEIIDKTRRAN